MTPTSIAPFQRFLQAHERIHFQWQMETDQPSTFAGDAAGHRFGQVTFSSVAIDQAWGSRNPANINPERENFLALIRITAGSMEVAQGRHENLIKPGDVFVWDVLKRCGFASSPGTRCQAVLFPRQWAEAHVGLPDQLSGRVVRPESLSGHLLSSHLATLHEGISAALADERQGLLNATLGLLSAATARQLKEAQCQHALLQRLLSEVQQRYCEPGFSPGAAANALHISTRYLRKILATQGQTFSGLLRKKRLQHAALALANPQLASRSLTDIAYSVGFSDSAHFSHLFKAEFACSPSQYRQTALAKPG